MFTLARYNCTLAVALSIGIVSAVAPFSAQATTFNSYDNGWYNSTGFHLPSNTRIYVSDSYRNFFAFDLSGAAGQTATSGQLIIPSNGDFFYASSPSTYDVFDYVGSISALLDASAGVAGYNDLGSGNTYGQALVYGGPASTPMPVVTVTLNAAALADINALLAGSTFYFALGGTCTTGCSLASLWSGSDGVAAGQLDLQLVGGPSEVPLPATLPLFASGIVGGVGYLSWRSWRRKAKQTA
jgi:hypothetical protein